MKELVDKTQLRTILGRDPALHVYELGDLDEPYFAHARWFASDDGAAVALLYSAFDPPVLVALGDGHAALLGALRDQLPAKLYAHLSPGLVDHLAPRFYGNSSGGHLKMRLVDRERAHAIDTTGAVALAPADREELEAFYAAAYPGNFFDPRSLASGQYVGVRERGVLVATAGVHVFAPTEGVAALGNIAVAPDQRGRGLATKVTAAATVSLLRSGIELVGLNVKADNAHAIRAYERVGFARVAAYEEHRLSARHFTPDYVERALLRDGTPVRLRLLVPEDKPLLRDGLERLSPESRYARFLAPKTQLTADELRYLTEVDQERHFALGAMREDGDGHGEPVGLGIARFVRVPDDSGGGRAIAEAAVAVVDAVHGQGLGKLLFLRLVAAASERGIERFRCEVLGTNTAMRELLRTIAPDASVEVGGGVMSIELALPSVAPTLPVAEAPPLSPMYRLFKAAASNAVEWTDAVRRLWRR